MKIEDKIPEEITNRPHRTLWDDAIIRLRRNHLAVTGAIVILLIALGAIVIPYFSPYEYDAQDLTAVMESPGTRHLLGTDALGRDSFTRLIYGARTSLSVGIFSQFIIIIIGIPIGAIAGAFGGKTDNFLMRFVDVIYAFPDILLILLLRSILGGSIYMIFLVIGLVSWPGIARLVRGQILSLKERDFLTAARAFGANNKYRIMRHLIPNSLGPIIVLITFSIPRAIFMEAALSYIGIGVQPPTPSWGTMINDGYNVIFATPCLIFVIYHNMVIFFAELLVERFGDVFGVLPN